MANFKYTIDENNAISLYNLDTPTPDNGPIIFQPCFPDGRPFESRSQAQIWVEKYIADYLYSHSNPLPDYDPYKNNY